LMRHRVTARWALAHPARPRARLGAAHAPPATANACSPARARSLSCRPCTVTLRHHSHLLHNTLVDSQPVNATAAPLWHPAAAKSYASCAAPTTTSGEAPIVLGSMDVATTAIGAGHLRTRAPDPMGYLKRVSAIVASEAPHPRHLPSPS
jgi:hypothetical protein